MFVLRGEQYCKCDQYWPDFRRHPKLGLARAEVGFFKSKVQSEDLSHGLQALSVGTKCPFVFIFVFVSRENVP